MNPKQLDFLELNKHDGDPPLWSELPEKDRAQVVERLAGLMAKMVATRFQRPVQIQQENKEKHDE